eukprot:Lithocolla_globosa_v1_NODE_138_length_5823_cov_17.507628.p1 type:complete len:551 gc:universal NODE_138_length_5823_cov_17.507628:3490-1838(-)
MDDSYVKVDDILLIALEDRFCCHWCRKNLDQKEMTLDRKDNKKAHNNDNYLISCNECNVKRGNKTEKHFKYEMRKQYYIEQNPQIYITSNKDIYDKLRSSMVGGPSIVFHRYHEANKTHIQRVKYDKENKIWRKKKEGIGKKIVGFDANALYLWCQGQDMPCGKLEYIDEDIDQEQTIQDVKDDELFGFIEVDIHVPEELYNKFGEMQPIFKNVEFENNSETVGEYMSELIKELEMKTSKQRKLIGSMFGEKVLLFSPLLKWYLEHGLVVTKVYSYIKAEKNKLYKDFVDFVSDSRRMGDSDKDMAVVAETAKIWGNGFAGHTIINKSKHTNTTYTDERFKASESINSPLFRSLDEVDDIYEIEKGKRKIHLNNPLHIGIAVYGWAKVKMLSFYYDFMDKYVSRDDFQYIEMDTDSAYMAITAEKFDINLIKPEMREDYNKHKHEWFVVDREDETYKYSRRVPGLFKIEYEGNGAVAVSPKVYIVQQDKDDYKMSCKGTQKKRNHDLLVFDAYKKAVVNKKILKVENSGFRLDNGKMKTCSHQKWYNWCL